MEDESGPEVPAARTEGVGAPTPWWRVVALGVAPVVLWLLLLAASHDLQVGYGLEHIAGFHDLRAVTHAVDCSRSGYDPLQTSRCIRVLPNYPRVWFTGLSILGVHESDTNLLGVAELVAFVGVVAALVRRSPGRGLIWLAVLCSPAVLMAIDSGNIDLFVFVLVAVSAMLADRHPSAVVLWGLSGILKLFPFAAAPAYCRSRRHTILVGVMALIGLVDLVVTRHDVSRILAIVPRVDLTSYGSPLAATDLGLGAPRLLGRLAAVAIVVGAVAWGRRSAALPPRPHQDLFVTGSLVYVATFSADVSWNYRLIFLLLCLPQLDAAWDDGALPKVVAALIIAVTWVGSPELGQGTPLVRALHETATWALAGALVTSWARGWFTTPTRAWSPRPPV